jgi:hypothetical protein
MASSKPQSKDLKILLDTGALPNFPTVNLEKFKSFLSKEHDSEGLEFYLAAKGFREDFDSKTVDTRKKTADSIIALFLTPGGTKEVAIDDATRRAVIKKCKDDEIKANALDSATDQVYEHLRLQNWVRFVNAVSK